MKHTSLLFLPLLGLVACSNPAEKTSKQPHQTDTQPEAATFFRTELPQEVFILTPGRDTLITTRRGCVIRIPAGSIVTEKGDNPQGPVHLLWDDMQDAADLLAAGVSMAYDSSGTRYYLQTGGMFRIKASDSHGQALQVAEQKPLEVRYRTEHPETSWNHYKWNEKGEEGWHYTGGTSVQPTRDDATVETTAAIPPLVPSRFNPLELAFDLRVRTQGFPELSRFKSIIWQPAGTEKPDSSLFTTRWKSVRLATADSEKGTYYLYLRRDTDSARVEVKPALSGKEYQQAVHQYEKQLQQYRLASKQAKSSREAARSAFHLFEVSGWGMYNCDRIWQMGPAPLVATVSFQLPDGTPLLQAEAFCITGDNRTVIPYTLRDGKITLTLPTQTPSRLLIPLERNRFALASPEQLLRLQGGEASERVQTITLQVVEKNLRSAQDLRSILL